MKRLEPQQMLGLRVMGKKGLDAYYKGIADAEKYRNFAPRNKKEIQQWH